jgi:hypothetical protein
MSEETNRWSDDYSGRWVNRAYMIVPVADINIQQMLLQTQIQSHR